MGLEADFLEWLRQHQQPNEASVRVGLGDDGAVVRTSPNSIVVSDTIADGTHFRINELDYLSVGRKAIAVNLSDIAAMGGRAEFAMLNLQCPKSAKLDELKELFLGAKSICDEFNVALIGGDTNVWDQSWVVSVTVIGHLLSQEPWRINGASPGNVISVTGPLGGSIHGRHHSFTPRLKLAAEIAKQFPVAAATDISDSLASDLHAILNASQAGAVIELDSIPISKAARQGPGEAIQHALFDGEDFELIVVFECDIWDELQTTPLARQLTKIGEVVEGEGLRTLDGRTIPSVGYQHG